MIVFLKIGFPLCILKVLCTGSIEWRQVLAPVRTPKSDETCFKPIYTDTNMCDQALRQEIEQFIEEIDNLKNSSPPLPEDWELALELRKDDETGESICSYYFVCHSTRCLFWLHEFDLEGVLGEVSGVTEKTHIRESAPVPGIRRTKHVTRPGTTGPVLVSGRHIVPMTSRLTIPRSHWEMFPHKREVSEDLSEELSGILFHAGIGTSRPVLDVVWLTSDLDCMTSLNSTTIYSEPELDKFLGYMKHIKRVGRNHGFSACVVGKSSVLCPSTGPDSFPRSLDEFLQ